MDCKYWTWMCDLIFQKQCKSQFQYFSLAVIVNNAGAALMRALFPEIFISKLYNPISNLYYSISQCCGWWMVEMFMDLRMLLCTFSYNIWSCLHGHVSQIGTGLQDGEFSCHDTKYKRSKRPSHALSSSCSSIRHFQTFCQWPHILYLHSWFHVFRFV